MNGGHFKPTSMWASVKEKEMSAFEQGVAWGAQHWKSNHDNIVKRLRVFTTREDLPFDRTNAYEELCKLQRQVQHLTESNRILEEALKRYEKR